jgi:cytochrome P450
MLSHLRSEVTEVLGNDNDDTQVPTYEQLKSLKYLRAMINESQRLHPIVP